jgi:hypothetical protein
VTAIVILSFLTWAVAVGCAVLSLAGNPVYRLCRRTPAPILQAAVTTIEQDNLEEADDDVTSFIQLASRWLLTLLALFLAELAVCVYFVSQRPTFWLCWFVLAKDVIAVAASFLLVHKRRWPNPIAALRELPPWVMRWERVNYFLSAVCFVVLFLVVNEIL